MKRSIGIFAIVAILVIATVSLVSAGTSGPIVPKTPPLSPPDGPMTDETPTAFFVQFESAPAVEGTSLQALANDKAAFLNEAAAIGLDFTERYTFSTLWNGMSISIAAKDVNKLYTLRGVTAVYPVVEVQRPTTVPGSSPDMANAIAMTGADIAQSELGFTGKGVKIAIMDTGVDYDHPDLGGCFGPFCKVMAGYDFVGDDYDAGTNPVPVPDDDPDDCQGHGTHVAGIAAANGEVVGVAPHARIGAYRVFGCDGSTDSDIMLAAMEMALADGMDVLNMSIGSAFWGWPEYPTAVGGSNLVDAGVVVVASIGNEGDYGLYAAGAPGTGEKVIGVASFDNTHATLPYALVDGLTEEIPSALAEPVAVGFIPMTYSGPIPTSGTESIIYVGQGCDLDLPLLADPTGQVALISRGACSFAEKAQNAIDAGATGVVIHNNAPGLFNGTLGATLDGVTPVVGISLEDGEYIRSLVEATWTWTEGVDSFESPTAGLISAFSSYGLAPDLSVKPDIGAPGGDIYSTYPIEQGSYASMGGTSMASPHVAGAVALYLEAFPGTPAGSVRAILQNSADPQLWNLNTSYGLYDHVYRQGAGLLDIDDAILAKSMIRPGKLSLGEGSAGPTTHTFTVSNFSPYPVVYDLSWMPAISANGIVEIEGFWWGGEDVSFSMDSLYIQPFGTKTVDVIIMSPDIDLEIGVMFWNAFYNGWIFFTPRLPDMPETDQIIMPEYSVPYAGFAGDYQDIEHLDNVYGLPALVDVDWFDVTEGQVFTMAGDDIPFILFHLDHQVEEVVVEVLSGLTGRRAHLLYFTAFDEEYWGRNAAYNNVFELPWDGTKILFNRNIMMPNGSYQLRMKVLKANGDAMNRDDWETWTSPVFVIDRNAVVEP